METRQMKRGATSTEIRVAKAALRWYRAMGKNCRKVSDYRKCPRCAAKDAFYKACKEATRGR